MRKYYFSFRIEGIDITKSVTNQVTATYSDGIFDTEKPFDLQKIKDYIKTEYSKMHRNIQVKNIIFLCIECID